MKGADGVGEKKSQGNIFHYSEIGQEKLSPKLAQDKELESTRDQGPVCTEQCWVSITKQLFQEQLRNIKSVEICKSQGGKSEN